MKFDKIVNIIFDKIPEFKESFDDELNKDYYNSFLSSFGLFTRDSIVKKEDYASKCLILINSLYNDSYYNKDFINKMNINILEILTDYPQTQKESVKNMDGKCLESFKRILNSPFFNNFINIGNSKN